ncbi:MAG: undecaprenyldiphospho-muramoylpentapeptide beta-N-acetylglucosaminyltransferase [Pseudomonadota bacterium]
MSDAPILIMAGGTGGHVYPALAIANALRERAQPVIWLGTRRGLEAQVVPAAGYPIEWLSISGLRGQGAAGWLMAPFRLLHAVYQAFRVIRKTRPQLVIGMGGFASGPGGIAAWLARVPVVIHEQNAVAGMTNRWLARIAARVLQGFPGAFHERVAATTVGNPVRADIRAVPAPNERFAGREGAQRLLIIGGSLGAQALNEMVADAIALLPLEQRPQIRHQAGSRTLEIAQDAYARRQVLAEVTPFIDDMAAAFAWADTVICRAGALTVAELSCVGVGAVFVPFPHAVDDHQTANAAQMVAHGAAVLLPQSELTPQSLQAALRSLGVDRSAWLARATKARELRAGDAVTRVLQACADVLQQQTPAGAV